MSGSLNGKTVIVLGGSSGIGLATAQAAQAEGAEVMITGRDEARLGRAREALGGKIRTGQFDAAHENPTREFFASIPYIDHIFSTAATLVGDVKLSPSRTELRPAMGVRFWAALYACKYGAPKMRAGGSLVLCPGLRRVARWQAHPSLPPPVARWSPLRAPWCSISRRSAGM